ncbi:Cysteine desulfurase [Arsenophonus endosymbiont of Aleurodicus dispersus]|uniref:cysteine desulfurase SufS n=1 Tax=Arsenophonus endosymbiont of Aleurodicus dispersus TaxID=235559 RepID=UPI000EB0AE7A|nr:cysteine desulfurase SufS [Arsenophonus endosymbiont of Aleurodicus dispersus]VAY02286.1 Cysteine desulfurase [Arsenophonus endosymbiont of Aleurodicus dispersus]
MTFSVASIRKDFPMLAEKIYGQPLVYLDSAASAQKPQQVIEKESKFICHHYAAVHRGIYSLSSKATAMVENVRQQVADFINAADAEEIVFVKGTTEGINLIANSYGYRFIKPGDNIIISQMEHHANIVPWHLLACQIRFDIRVLPIDNAGKLIFEQLDKLIDSRTRLLSFTHMSNVLGTVNPVKKIIAYARQCAEKKKAQLHIVLDGAQSIMHQMIDVQDLDCDFYVFSGHKLYGPTGIGVLYGKKILLNALPPWQGGGAIIDKVSMTLAEPSIINITYENAPWRFEAGTLNIVGIIGLGEALRYVNNIGYQQISAHETSLMQYANQRLSTVKSLRFYGSDERQGVIALNLGDHHAYDVGSFLDNYGIAIRTGHHCALPLMNFYQVPAMCRVSLAVYTTKEEIDILVEKLQHIEKLLG